MTDNSRWLTDNADAPIRYVLNGGAEDGARLAQNDGAAAWLSRLAERSLADRIGAVHGSHDYRMENILGKCWILGFDKNIPAFAENIGFIPRFLNGHIESGPPGEPGFGRIYHYRDYEKVLCYFLPLLKFYGAPSVLYIARERIERLYAFTSRKRYDIYIDGSKLAGVKKEWRPYVIDPDLYADGHIALPDAHDFILFAGLIPYLSEDEKNKVETITGWLFGEGYDKIIRRYGYFYAPGGSYSAKAVTFKLHLPELYGNVLDNNELASLIINAFILSHFETARSSAWFASALAFLERYKNENGRYNFPPGMITEKPDSYVIFGGHMNPGENKKSKLYNEIVSTYWAERIRRNIERV